jgi:hypothetical protein
MLRSAGCLVLLTAFCLLPTATRADAIVSSTLNLTQIQITPSSDLVVISPFSSAAFAQVYDSLGGADFEYDRESDTSASVSAATTLLSAEFTALAESPLTMSGTADLDIPDIGADGGTNPGCCYGQLQGFFEIYTGNTDPVSTTVTAFLTESQSVTTTADGLSASSEVTFALNLYDYYGDPPQSFDSPLLFYDDAISVGPNSTFSDSNSSDPSMKVQLLGEGSRSRQGQMRHGFMGRILTQHSQEYAY